ncbi:hypothetical protein QUB67_11400 [Microcoleus sp. ARI1-A1]
MNADAFQDIFRVLQLLVYCRGREDKECRTDARIADECWWLGAAV